MGTYLAGWQPDPDGPVQTWAGLRPTTPDGLPLIGALSGLDDIYLATGHGMLGVTLAPATANLLAPLVLEGPAAPELTPFDPARRLCTASVAAVRFAGAALRLSGSLRGGERSRRGPADARR